MKAAVGFIFVCIICRLSWKLVPNQLRRRMGLQEEPTGAPYITDGQAHAKGGARSKDGHGRTFKRNGKRAASGIKTSLDLVNLIWSNFQRWLKWYQ